MIRVTRLDAHYVHSPFRRRSCLCGSRLHRIGNQKVGWRRLKHMNLRHLFRRPPDPPPLSDEEWATIAAALRAMPIPPARRNFYLTAEQAERLRPRKWSMRLAIPAPLATGLAAVLLLVALAPALLNGLAASTVVPAAPVSATAGPFFGSFEQSGGVTFDNSAASASPLAPVGAPKALDACPSFAVTAASPSPSPSPSPQPALSSVTPPPSAAPNPVPTCDPAP